MSLLVFAGFYLMILINKIISQTVPDLSLMFINGTNSECQMSNGATVLTLCANDNYYYQCHNYSNYGYGGNSNNISLGCELINNQSNCYNIFISSNNDNITLNCIYQYIATDSLNTYSLEGNNECLYSVYYEQPNTENTTLLVCTAATPISNPSSSSGSKYYTFKFFGWKIRRHFVKTYGIPILIAAIVVFCFLGWCCCGTCYLCCSRSSQNQSKKKQKYTYTHCTNENQRMPQSSNIISV